MLPAGLQPSGLGSEPDVSRSEQKESIRVLFPAGVRTIPSQSEDPNRLWGPENVPPWKGQTKGEQRDKVIPGERIHTEKGAVVQKTPRC